MILSDRSPLKATVFGSIVWGHVKDCPAQRGDPFSGSTPPIPRGRQHRILEQNPHHHPYSPLLCSIEHRARATDVGWFSRGHEIERVGPLNSIFWYFVIWMGLSHYRVLLWLFLCYVLIPTNENHRVSRFCLIRLFNHIIKLLLSQIIWIFTTWGGRGGGGRVILVFAGTFSTLLQLQPLNIFTALKNKLFTCKNLVLPSGSFTECLMSILIIKWRLDLYRNIKNKEEFNLSLMKSSNTINKYMLAVNFISL